jgi:hypothetical protein
MASMTNIGAINSKHTKTYGITKNHGLPWKVVTPCYQIACHVHHHMEDWVDINKKKTTIFSTI